MMVKNVLYSALTITICLVLGKLIAATIGGLPASLYGMLIFTCALHFQLANADKISSTITWIIQNMGVCFVPAGVGIINHFQLIKSHGLALVAIIFISTFILLTFVGLGYQYIIDKADKGNCK